MPPLGLYVHVPFCAAICNYCHFSRGLLDADLKRRYVEAVRREIARAGEGQPVDTIYFGGGTPSVLDPGEVAAIVGACRDAFAVDGAAEVTLEANPESAAAGMLAACREAGVNRLSLGVQSFRDQELRRLGRLHDAARAREAVADARRAGFDNVSLDLMLGLPGQALAGLDESLEALVALGPEHASVYLLEVWAGAPLEAEMARGGWTRASDDEAADMYLRAMERLEQAGYRQYEISNVARPGRESRHNVKYWTDGEWLGFGPAAHSTIGAERWSNVTATSEYVRLVEAGQSPVGARRALSPRARLEEALFMELRLADGIRLDRVRRTYGVDVWQEWGSRLARFEEAGLLLRDVERERLRLTRRGMLLASDVMITFLESGSTVK